MNTSTCCSALAVGTFLSTILLLSARTPAQEKAAEPSLSAADELAKDIKKIRVPDGTKLELFAAEPMVANPVGLAIDERNRVFVAETHKQKYIGPPRETEIADERIRLLEDTTGSGKADRSTVFADGFKGDVGFSLLPRRGTVWYTCLPDLWRLTEKPGASQAEAREAVHTGFGLQTGAQGHALYGLCLGPDGKLYFSGSDRGFSVTTPAGTVSHRGSGAVLRCNLDGSDLEIFATGFRNPRGLAFDRFGNLFTGDSNSTGDPYGRLIHIIEGGDSGWRVGQASPWEPALTSQIAYMLPPVGHLSGSPSSIVFEPGTGALPPRFKDHLFLTAFRIGVYSLALEPKGASFAVTDVQRSILSDRTTDVAFGTDGALYFCDYMGMAAGVVDKGRVFKVHDPALAQDASVQQTKQLLAEGFEKRSHAELAKLIDHPDMRIRQEAQFALVDQPEGAAATLLSVAQQGPPQARLHAIWGLGQLGRKSPAVLDPLVAFLDDPDAEVRAQAARVLGDARVAAAYEALVRKLQDSAPRVRFFAAQAMTKMGRPEATAALLQMLRESADQDAYLRYAGVSALVRIGDLSAISAAANDESPAVRLAVLLTLRRLERPEIAQFLADREPRLVLEAARAIGDTAINFREGPATHVRALAAFVARPGVPVALCVGVIRRLATAGQGADPQTVEAVRAALLGGVFRGSDMVRQEGAQLAARFAIKDIGPALRSLMNDRDNSSATRAEMLYTLAALRDPQLSEAMNQALASDDARLRAAGRRVQARQVPEEALAGLAEVLERGEWVERQAALATLADMKTAASEKLLLDWAVRLAANDVPVEMQLDLLEAATRRQTKDVKQQIDKFEATRPKKDHLARYRETLAGGDAAAGELILRYKLEVHCLRCHKYRGEGHDTGPDLTAVGRRLSREALLESIVEPNRQIAKGFESVVLELDDGRVVAGIVKDDDGQNLIVKVVDGPLQTIAKSQIEKRHTARSPMPDEVMKILTKRELRDLVEFLANQVGSADGR